MKKVIDMVSTTIKGGVFFLLPLVLIIVLFEKVLKLIQPLSGAVQELLDPSRKFYNFPFIFSIIALLLVCFLAGWAAKLGAGQKLVGWIENNLLSLFPGYSLMKSTFESKVGIANSSNFPVVLVPIDGMMFGFHVDTLDNGDLVVFIPGAPSVWEGSVVIFPKDKVTKTDYKQDAIIKIMRELGTHTQAALIKSLEKPVSN